LVPTVVEPMKAKKQAPKAAPNAAPSEGGVEAVKRRLNRLALDVHDGPMQNLAVIGFSLGDLRRKMHALVPSDHHAGIDAGMEQIGAELGRVEDELRALIGALEHGVVTSGPFVDAIQMEVADFGRRSAVVPELIVVGEPRTETDSQRIALQSVTRAALANVAKHAAAKTVKIRLVGAPEAITLEIEDDGRGFDPSRPPKGHFGSTGCASAADARRHLRRQSRRAARRRSRLRSRRGGPPPASNERFRGGSAAPSTGPGEAASRGMTTTHE
jgi:signal transduction histidine kinase